MTESSIVLLSATLSADLLLFFLASQPAEVIVQTHIRRLKEYNDMKDIGQQLIGLVAENRGVPVGTLYESGEFGVSAKD